MPTCESTSALLLFIYLTYSRYDGEDAASKPKQSEDRTVDKSTESNIQAQHIATTEDSEEDNRFANPITQNGADGPVSGMENAQNEQNATMDYDAVPFEVDESTNPVGIKEDG